MDVLTKELTYEQFMMFLQLVRQDAPAWSNSQPYHSIAPEDHRLLAAYYTNALGLEPMAALVLVYRLIKRAAQTTSLFLRYHDNHARSQCIVCEQVYLTNGKLIKVHVKDEVIAVTRLTELLQGYKPKLAMLRSCVTTA